MKRLVAVVIVAAAFSSGCAPMFVPPHQYGYTPMPVSPVGRWDAVMALERASLIGVMTADGVTHTGRFVVAGLHWLRMHEHGMEIQIPRDEVARVDFLRGPRSSTGKDIARGAAAGALLLGLAEMLIGSASIEEFWMPPAKTWAVGAVGGAAAGAFNGMVRNAERTIYVAP